MNKSDPKGKNVLESPTRSLEGKWAFGVTIYAIAMSLVHLYTAAFGTFPAMIQRSMHLIFAIPLIFMLYPSNNKKKTNCVQKRDIVLVCLSLFAFGWIIIQYPRIALRMPYVDSLNIYDYIFGISSILLVLEANRRSMGWPLVLITGIAIIFNFMGPYIPGVFGHSSCSLSFFLDHVYLNTEGVFSNIVGIASTYVIIFILFGAFMDVSAMGKFFLDLCNALTGKYPGGAAKTAVLASGMMGSISGSGVANVVTTGAFTIPLMIKTGYSREEAGAIETAAACGGQMLPPVMGAGAFVMAEFTGIPYIDIVKVSVIPAIMYFGIVFLFVHLKAHKKGLKGLTKEHIPVLLEVLKTGSHLLIPLFVLVWMLLKGYTPFFAGVISISLIIIVSMFKKEKRFTIQKLCKALDLGARRAISMASAAACAGLILGVVSQTGFGVRMSSMILSISQGNLLITIILVAIVGYILGMGLTVVTAYIIASVLAVPALVHLGIPLLVAHLMVFWFCQTSNVSPPVCLAAYAAAAISGGNSMKTGFLSLKYSSGMILIPILFAYTPIVFLEYQPTIFSFIWTVLCLGLSLILYVMASEGYVSRELNKKGVAILSFAAIGLYLPFLFSRIFGLALITLSVLIYKRFLVVHLEKDVQRAEVALKGE